MPKDRAFLPLRAVVLALVLLGCRGSDAWSFNWGGNNEEPAAVDEVAAEAPSSQNVRGDAREESMKVASQLSGASAAQWEWDGPDAAAPEAGSSFAEAMGAPVMSEDPQILEEEKQFFDWGGVDIAGSAESGSAGDASSTAGKEATVDAVGAVDRADGTSGVESGWGSDWGAPAAASAAAAPPELAGSASGSGVRAENAAAGIVSNARSWGSSWNGEEGSAATAEEQEPAGSSASGGSEVDGSFTAAGAGEVAVEASNWGSFWNAGDAEAAGAAEPGKSAGSSASGESKASEVDGGVTAAIAGEVAAEAGDWGSFWDGGDGKAAGAAVLSASAESTGSGEPGGASAVGESGNEINSGWVFGWGNAAAAAHKPSTSAEAFAPGESLDNEVGSSPAAAAAVAAAEASLSLEQQAEEETAGSESRGGWTWGGLWGGNGAAADPASATAAEASVDAAGEEASNAAVISSETATGVRSPESATGVTSFGTVGSLPTGAASAAAEALEDAAAGQEDSAWGTGWRSDGNGEAGTAEDSVATQVYGTEADETAGGIGVETEADPWAFGWGRDKEDFEAADFNGSAASWEIYNSTVMEEPAARDGNETDAESWGFGWSSEAKEEGNGGAYNATEDFNATVSDETAAGNANEADVEVWGFGWSSEAEEEREGDAYNATEGFNATGLGDTAAGNGNETVADVWGFKWGGDTDEGEGGAFNATDYSIAAVTEEAVAGNGNETEATTWGLGWGEENGEFGSYNATEEFNATDTNDVAGGKDNETDADVWGFTWGAGETMELGETHGNVTAFNDSNTGAVTNETDPDPWGFGWGSGGGGTGDPSNTLRGEPINAPAAGGTVELNANETVGLIGNETEAEVWEYLWGDELENAAENATSVDGEAAGNGTEEEWFSADPWDIIWPADDVNVTDTAVTEISAGESLPSGSQTGVRTSTPAPAWNGGGGFDWGGTLPPALSTAENPGEPVGETPGESYERDEDCEVSEWTVSHDCTPGLCNLAENKIEERFVIRWPSNNGAACPDLYRVTPCDRSGCASGGSSGSGRSGSTSADNVSDSTDSIGSEGWQKASDDSSSDDGHTAFRPPNQEAMENKAATATQDTAGGAAAGSGGSGGSSRSLIWAAAVAAVAVLLVVAAARRRRSSQATYRVPPMQGYGRDLELQRFARMGDHGDEFGTPRSLGNESSYHGHGRRPHWNL